jgi:hypothetical protein
VAEPFPRYENWGANMESERVVFEGRAVSFSHQEVDEFRVAILEAVVHFPERNTGGVYDRKVVSHDVVEANKSVVQYWAKLVTHGRTLVEDSGADMESVFSSVRFSIFFRHSAPKSERFIFEGIFEAFLTDFALSTYLTCGFHFLDQARLMFFRIKSRRVYGAAIRSFGPSEINS